MRVLHRTKHIHMSVVNLSSTRSKRLDVFDIFKFHRVTLEEVTTLKRLLNYKVEKRNCVYRLTFVSVLTDVFGVNVSVHIRVFYYRYKMNQICNQLSIN